MGRWGYKQSLTVAQTQGFGNNFYGISKINKNWGDKRPGQFDIGALYAQNEVFYVNNVVSGVALKLTDKDTVGTHIVFLDSTEAPHSISHLNSWTHKFSSNFYSTIFVTFRYNAPTNIGPDNNWFIGVNLTGLF